MATQIYLIALGSNRRSRWGSPRRLIERLMASPLVIAASCVHVSRPLGSGTRSFANSVAVVETHSMPPALLACLKAIERAHGRRAGRRWGDRVLDLDIIGWSGGAWRTRALTIPHPSFRDRRFVLAPLVEIAPDWRDPVTGLTPCHLLSRLARRRRSRLDPISPQV